MVIGNIDKDVNFLCEIKNKAWHRILIFNNMRENTALEKYQSWTKEPRAWSRDPAPSLSRDNHKERVCCMSVMFEIVFCNLAINQKAN